MTERRPFLICAKCGSDMKLARTVPRLAVFPALLTYQCAECNHVQTIEDEQAEED